LVDSVFRLAQLGPARRVQVAMPLGDSELLDRLHDHLGDVHTRAAGATCLIEATTPATDRRR
jgi:hypothetical protein